MLIDIHCHLDEHEYKDLDKLMEEILDSEVKMVIVSGSDIKSSNEAIELAHKYDFVYATVGFHPHNCMNLKEHDYQMFDKWLTDKKVIAIGEIGLDYYYDEEVKDKQIEVFKRQIEIAEAYQRPVIIHERNASEDIYDILKNCNVKGIIHCFNGSLESANKFIDLGFLLGIGGIITFKKNNLKEVVKDIPLDYLVLETDSPYLTPVPFRGKQNTPLNLPLVASAMALIKEVTYSEIVSRTSNNVKHLFDFN
ncbi:MAG: TatD family hydrolase [Bacilli bacterium]|nr:TatD family hydrolase [Bacilli bacterium]MDD3304663.1 TatD family hydrolase [Bacilli bacterium]MDD4053285.1 TatD family hydrolase [Bacilli bacterium]MDD4411374.1 TatD family hydrolase [Bacilli bacterium]